MARQCSFFRLMIVLCSCMPPPAFAVPVESALSIAQKLKSSYAAVFLKDDPKLQGDVVITDINNQGTVIGYLSQGSLLNPSGGYTNVPTGIGFVMFANGSTLYTSELTGTNFIPLAANDRGQIAGLAFDLQGTQPLIPVVFYPPNSFLRIGGIPPAADSLTVADIDNYGTVLLSVVSLVDAGTDLVGPTYAAKTMLGIRGSDGEYRAVQTEIPPLSGSTSRFYTPLRSPSRFGPPYETVSGPVATHLTDSGIIYGWKSYGTGFRFSNDRGLEYLFPGSGPISDTTAVESMGSQPWDLGGNDLLLTTSSVLSTATGLPVASSDKQLRLVYSAASVRVDGAVLGMRSEGPRTGDVVLSHPPGVIEDIRCAIPQGTRHEIDGGITMNDTGWIVVQGHHLDRNIYSPIVLIPTPFKKPGAADFCPTVTARFLDRCAKGKNDRGEYFLEPNMQCRLAFTLRDSKNKPIPRADAVLKNGNGDIVSVARTDSRGRGTFRHKFDPRSESYSVVGPFRHKQFRNGSATLTVYGNVNRPYTGGGA